MLMSLMVRRMRTRMLQSGRVRMENIVRKNLYQRYKRMRKMFLVSISFLMYTTNPLRKGKPERAEVRNLVLESLYELTHRFIENMNYSWLMTRIRQSYFV